MATIKRSRINEIILEEIEKLILEAKYRITKAGSGFGDRFFNIVFKKKSIPAGLWKKLDKQSGDFSYGEKEIISVLKSVGLGNPKSSGGSYSSWLWNVNGDWVRIGEDWNVSSTNDDNYIQMEKVQFSP